MKRKIINDKNYHGCVNTLDPKDDKRIPKYVKQFKERGFDDTETWNLQYVILNFTLPRLKRFKELNCGFPGNLTWEQWNEIIDKMIAGIELFIEDNPDHWNDKEKEKQINEGLELFHKWFLHLWW